MNRTRWFHRFVLCSLTAILLIVEPIVSSEFSPPIALGQLPSLTAPSLIQPFPAGVERRGTLESAPLRLDGKELFRITSPAVLNRTSTEIWVPVEVRAETNRIELGTTDCQRSRDWANSRNVTGCD